MGLGLATALKGAAEGIQAFGAAEQRQRQDERLQRQQDAQQLQQLIQLQQPIITELAVNNPAAVEPHVDQLKAQNSELIERMGLKDLKIFGSVGGSTTTTARFKVTQADQERIFKATGVRPALGSDFEKTTNSKTNVVTEHPVNVEEGLVKLQRQKQVQALVSGFLRKSDILAAGASLFTDEERKRAAIDQDRDTRFLVEVQIPSVLATGKLANREMTVEARKALTDKLRVESRAFDNKEDFKKALRSQKEAIERQGFIFSEVEELADDLFELDQAAATSPSGSIDFLRRLFPGAPIGLEEPRRELAQTREQVDIANTTAVPEQTVPAVIQNNL